MALHADEVVADPALVRSLLADQRPDLAGLALTPAGHGTDNTMYRLGRDLLVRLPRTPGTARALGKELEWLPRLSGRLGCEVPEPVHHGSPGSGFPLPWSVYRWVDGEAVRADTVTDWAALGADLASVVTRLHQLDLPGAHRAGELAGYRGGPLAGCAEWFARDLATCRSLEGLDLDLDALADRWRHGLDAGDPDGRSVLLHTDLKPTNLLVRDGALAAVIDFGGLTVGHPDAEHATVWDLPAPAREAYRTALALDGATWARARAWAVLVGLSGLAYYWHSYPAFVAECRARLRRVLTEDDPAPH